MRLGVGECVIGQNNGQEGQRQDRGESKIFCLRLAIVRSHWIGVWAVGLGGEDNPASVLAQPPALQFSGPHQWHSQCGQHAFPWDFLQEFLSTDCVANIAHFF